MRVGEEVYILADQLSIEQFSLTCPAAMQINCNKRKCLHKKRVQLPQYWFGTQTWPPFQCVLEHQYGCHDVMWKCWITFTVLITRALKISFYLLWTVFYIYNKQNFFLRPLYKIGIVWTVFVHQFPNLRKSLTHKIDICRESMSDLPNWSVNFTSSFQHNI